MNKLNKIINEEINRFLIKEFFEESDDSSVHHLHHDNGEEHHNHHFDTQKEKMKEKSEEYHKFDTDNIHLAKEIVSDKGINNYEIFRQMNKNGTSFDGYDEKSGSRYMEKKAKGESAPSGDKYKLTGRDAKAIVQAYNNMLPK
jgi:hypothetical protein